MSAGENTEPASAEPQPASVTLIPDASAIEALAELEAGLLAKLRAAAKQQQEHQRVLEAREQALLAREQEASEIKSRLSDLAGALAAEKALLAQDHAREVEALGRDRNDITAARETIAKELDALRSAQETITQERAALGNTRAVLDAREAELEVIVAAAEERAAAFETAAAARERAIAERETSAGAANDRALSEATAAREAIATELNTTKTALENERAERERLAASLEASQNAGAEAARSRDIAVDAHHAAQESLTHAHAAELASERAGREALMGVVQEYEAWLACERAEWVALSGALGEARAEIRQAGEVIEALKGRLKEALSAQAARAQTGPAASSKSASWVEHRRARLEKVRDAMSRRIIRLQKGEEALTKRFDMCEQILSQRAALAATHQKLRATEQRHQAVRAKSRAAAVGLCGSLMLVVLAGLSWAVAREFAPARFEAESVVSAESRGRELGEGELAEWQRYHESLLMDPLFHEAAADRFKRQGVEQLVTPGQVSELVSKELTIESLKDGELRLRLKGQGADQTSRVLDTLTAALASHANAASGRRIDGGLTKVAQSAKPGDRPIDQTRNVWALITFGGATVTAFILVGLVYLRLSRAKTQFEQDSTIATTLDEARWVDPRTIAD